MLGPTWVEQHRKRNGISQRELARRSGISLALIRRIEAWSFLPGPTIEGKLRQAIGPLRRGKNRADRKPPKLPRPKPRIIAHGPIDGPLTRMLASAAKRWERAKETYAEGASLLG